MTPNRKKIGPFLSWALPRKKRSGSVRPLKAMAAAALFLALTAVGFAPCRVVAADNPGQISNLSLSFPPNDASPATVETQPAAASIPKRANFEQERKSQEAQKVADWVVDSADNRGMPFMIIDKTDAKVFVFEADGRLRGAAPVLIGIAKGDDSVPDIGDRKFAQMRTHERTTPAGRFVAALGLDFHGKDVFWVDYENAVSLHRVVTNNPKERRLERLATPTPADNRISFGCINVPAKFYDSVVNPTFTGTYGIVYVLPDTRPQREVFASYYDVDQPPQDRKPADSGQ